VATLVNELLYPRYFTLLLLYSVSYHDHHGIPWKSPCFTYGVSMEYMESHSILWEYHGALWSLYDPMVFQGSFHGLTRAISWSVWKSMELHVILRALWHSMEEFMGLHMEFP